MQAGISTLILIQTRIETKCSANGQQAVASISALRTKYKVGGAKIAAQRLNLAPGMSVSCYFLFTV